MRSVAVPTWIREPWAVLAPLVVVQWLALLAFALTVRHNGWLYYQGGDETFYYTGAWALGHGHLPPTASVGYGWSLVLAPFSWFAGPSLLAALPAIVLFQTLVLLPVVLACVYGIAARVGGRLIGYLAAAAWVTAPYLAIPFFDQRYHDRYVEQFLPQALGLTGLADFPSMVALLAAAYFAFRALDSGGRSAAIASGLATGFALGLKPSNAFYLAAPVLAFLLARRWRALVWTAAALVPAFVTLAIWKQRGLGHIPAFSLEQQRLAAGTAQPFGALQIRNYILFDWSRLQANFVALREFFWPIRVIEWLPVAGLLAIARRSLARAAFAGAWFAAFLLTKGSSQYSTVESGSFFRFLMPAFPAFLLLAAAIPLLVPTAGPKLAARFPLRPAAAPSRRRLLAAAGLAALVPFLVIATLPRLPAGRAAKYFTQGVLVPVSDGLRLKATAASAAVSLGWPGSRTGSTRVFYRIFRSQGSEDLSCDHTGVADCSLPAEPIATTALTAYVDRPPPGTWTYRIGLAANWRNDPQLGDVLLLGRPATIRVPPLVRPLKRLTR